jgi:hypothetical protein
MMRYLSFLVSVAITFTIYSCKADEVWENANRAPNIFYISSVVATSTNTVKVTLSQEADESDANNPSNYSIPGLTITDALRDGTDSTLVNLSTSNHEDINYTLTITGLTDTSGNLMGIPNSMKFAGDVAPMIKSVSATGSTSVMVYFSEPVDKLSVEDAANYTADGGLTINTAVRDASDYSRVILTTSPQNSISYKLTISNVTDVTGNSLANPNYEYFTGIGATDLTNPRVLFAAMIDSNTVEVIFSEPVEEISSENTGNYTLKDSQGNPIPVITATRQTDDQSHVGIDISGALSDHLYIVQVAGVTDTALNVILGFPYNIAAFNGTGSVPDSFNEGPLIVDPLNEGINNFSMLASYRGRIYLAPANADNAAFRFKPDGSDPAIVPFMFHGAAGDTTTLNTGPDGEDGIDYIASGIVAGVEYLFFGPSRSFGDLDYLYYTTDTGSTIDFDYMDLSGFLGPQTKGVSSLFAFNDRLYAGFPDTGGNRPYLLKLTSIDSSPAGVNLQAVDMPRIGLPDNGAAIVGIDTMALFEGLLYIANGGNNALDEDGGIIMSLNGDPAPYPGAPDWLDITPVADTEWYNSPSDDRFSIELTGTNKLMPADRAFPAMAEFKGKLYIARNTTKGPQLWKYLDGIFTLIADNGSGITDMSDSDNTRITLLIVNKNILYIGFDNSSDGIQVFRSDNPSDQASFDAVTLNGFGQGADIDTIYHAVSVPDGGKKCLWLLCGKSGGKLRIYRRAE